MLSRATASLDGASATATVYMGLACTVSLTAVLTSPPDALLAAFAAGSSPVPGTTSVLRTRCVARCVTEQDGRGAVGFLGGAATRVRVSLDAEAGTCTFNLSSQGALKCLNGQWRVARELAGGGCEVELALALTPLFAPSSPAYRALLAPCLVRQALACVARLRVEVDEMARAKQGAPSANASVAALFAPGVGAAWAATVASVRVLCTQQASSVLPSLAWTVAAALAGTSTALRAPRVGRPGPASPPLLVRAVTRPDSATASSLLQSHPVARRPRRSAVGTVAAWHVPPRQAAARQAAARLAMLLALLVLFLSLAVVAVALARRARVVAPLPPLPLPPPPPPPPLFAAAIDHVTSLLPKSVADRAAAALAAAATATAPARAAAAHLAADALRVARPAIIDIDDQCAHMWAAHGPAAERSLSRAVSAYASARARMRPAHPTTPHHWFQSIV